MDGDDKLMSTIWVHRINVIIPTADIGGINALWTIIAPGGDAEARSFGVPLSADGNDPATHTSISTAATETMRLLMVDAFAVELAGAIISSQPYTQNDWTPLLAANGLQVIQPKDI